MIDLLNVILLSWCFIALVSAWKPRRIPMCIGFTLCMGILAILDKLS